MMTKAQIIRSKHRFFGKDTLIIDKVRNDGEVSSTKSYVCKINKIENVGERFIIYYTQYSSSVGSCGKSVSARSYQRQSSVVVDSYTEGEQ